MDILAVLVEINIKATTKVNMAFKVGKYWWYISFSHFEI